MLLRRDLVPLEIHLNAGVEMSEDVVDLVLESSRQHLVGLVEDEHLDVVGTEDLAGDHVEDATGRA